MEQLLYRMVKDQSYTDIFCEGEWVMGVEYSSYYIWPNRLFFLRVHIIKARFKTPEDHGP